MGILFESTTADKKSLARGRRLFKNARPKRLVAAASGDSECSELFRILMIAFIALPEKEKEQFLGSETIAKHGYGVYKWPDQRKSRKTLRKSYAHTSQEESGAAVAVYGGSREPAPSELLCSTIFKTSTAPHFIDSSFLTPPGSNFSSQEATGHYQQRILYSKLSGREDCDCEPSDVITLTSGSVILPTAPSQSGSEEVIHMQRENEEEYSRINSQLDPTHGYLSTSTSCPAESEEEESLATTNSGRSNESQDDENSLKLESFRDRIAKRSFLADLLEEKDLRLDYGSRHYYLLSDQKTVDKDPVHTYVNIGVTVKDYAPNYKPRGQLLSEGHDHNNHNTGDAQISGLTQAKQ